ncbi:MAG: hypothetical protein WEA10_04920 [Actinomycetota bacterium]
MTGARDIFTRRGINPEVRDARPYVRFERGDYSAAIAADPTVRATYLQWLTGNSDGGGYVMLKTPVPGAPPVNTQFRPDNPVRKRERDGSITEAKYLLQRAPRAMYAHTHPLKSGNTARHVANKHGGKNVVTEHQHESPRKDPDQSPEKRLDMHPLSAALLPSARRVFFALEGVLKADALLSAGECVFDVPSVTLWQAPELEAFARTLTVPVYVVPDADWADNPQVALQAFECRERLRGHGVDAHVAAPPGPDKGVDDFLGGGGRVEDMAVLEREMSPGFHAWARSLDVRADRAKTDVAVMAWLALHADDSGTALKSAQIIAQYVGRAHQVVHRSVARLLDAGVVTWDGDLVFHFDRFIRVERRRKPFNLGPGWAQLPRLVLRDDLRAVQRKVSIEGRYVHSTP